MVKRHAPAASKRKPTQQQVDDALYEAGTAHEGLGKAASKRKKRSKKAAGAVASKLDTLEWQTVEVNDHETFGFMQEGFCGLQELHGYEVLQDEEGQLSVKKLEHEPAVSPPAPPPAGATGTHDAAAGEEVSAEVGGDEALEPTGEAQRPSKSARRKRRQKEKLASAKAAGLKPKAGDKEKDLKRKAARAAAAAQAASSRDGTGRSKKKPNKAKRPKSSTDEVEGAEEAVGKSTEETDEGEALEDHAQAPGAPEDLDMSAWRPFNLDPILLENLKMQGFGCPSEIQSHAILPALRDRRDVVGAAETGSGKTLAFALPILQQILTMKESRRKTQEDAADTDGDGAEPPLGLLALIVAPTRELALQVTQHVTAVARGTSIRIAAVVGGLALPKQERMLRKAPEIVVATPGRLWDVISQGHDHFADLRGLQFLVIDEADRMIEKGHYEELETVLGRLPDPMEVKPRPRQTFVFSATLTMKLDQQGRKGKKKRKKGAQKDPEDRMERIVDQCQLRPNPFSIDLTSTKTLASGLTERRIVCLVEEKDRYLYYLLKKHPGRTIVFTNSIDCVRRLLSVLKLLQCEPLGLHAQMQQRQRLKNLDRFKTRTNTVLVATDVAARGLDISGIEHVVHYQVPRTTDAYVHRSGRTARASSSGMSVILQAPEETRAYKRIIADLDRATEVPAYEVDMSYLPAVKRVVSLATRIDKAQRRLSKTGAHNNWFIQAAKEADLELDDRLLEEAPEDEVRAKAETAQNLKLLQSLLAQPLLPKHTRRGFAAGGRPGRQVLGL